MTNIASATKLDLAIADARGELKYTVLPTRHAKKSELVLTRTNGVRTNTNRRGQGYNCRATRSTRSNIAANGGAYFKTSGWLTETLRGFIILSGSTVWAVNSRSYVLARERVTRL